MTTNIENTHKENIHKNSNEPEESTETLEKREQPSEPSFIDVTMSVIAAAFGVQNSKNRERDFSRGNPLVFIAAGVMFTVVFILTIVGVVYLVLQGQ